MPSHTPAHSTAATAPDDRRGFVKRVLATVIGALCALIPGGAALWTFLDPLRRRTSDAAFLPVTSPDAVPADGVPRLFKVVADRTDAWNRYPQEPIGAVFLMRTAEEPDRVVAFNATCPHLGCMVGFQSAQSRFYCPCHQSAFQVDGELIPPSAAARNLDRLEAKIEGAAEKAQIVVKYVNFRSGIAEQVPIT